LTATPGSAWEAVAWPVHLLSVGDLTCVALSALLDAALEIERDPARYRDALAGETLACLIDPPAAAEPLAPARAAARLGMAPVLLARDELLLADAEQLGDVARALSASASALLTHTFSHRLLKAVAAEATVPVINALSDRHRPCQAVADLLTLRRHFGDLGGLRLAYIGDGGASIAHSLMEAGALAGMDVRIGCPPAYRPDRLIEYGARVVAELHGGRVSVIEDAGEAVTDADAVYTTAWRTPAESLRPYRVTPRLMKRAGPDAVFMHCLPAGRGQEVSAAVIDGPRSVVPEQSANRALSDQALLYALCRR
jgi:ornithine carbamoyltransferase